MDKKRYIEVETAYSIAKKVVDAIANGEYHAGVFAYDIMDWIDELPAADVRPAVRGKWEKMSPWSEGVGMGETYGYYYSCSECEKQVRGDYKTCGFAYCPSCGAVMDES